MTDLCLGLGQLGTHWTKTITKEKNPAAAAAALSSAGEICALFIYFLKFYEVVLLMEML